jgi:hypothetical protein
VPVWYGAEGNCIVGWPFEPQLFVIFIRSKIIDPMPHGTMPYCCELPFAFNPLGFTYPGRTFISRCSNGAYSNSSRGGLKEDYQRAADAANALYPETETEMIRIPHTNPHDPHSACYLESDIVRSIPPHPARHTKAVMIKIQDCTTCP